MHLLVHLIKIIFYFGKRVGVRLDERQVLTPQKGIEEYPGIFSELSKVIRPADKVAIYSVRVPCLTPLKFSVLFPDAISPVQDEYFSEQIWANFFTDSRNPHAIPKKKGYILYWTDEAMGTKSIVPRVWGVAGALPNELRELHADGNYLRALFYGSQEELNKINFREIQRELKVLAMELITQPVSRVTRSRVLTADGIRFLAVASLFLLIVLIYELSQKLLPHLSLIDSGSHIAWGGGLFFLSTIVFVLLLRKRQGNRDAASLGFLGGAFFAAIIMIVVVYANVQLVTDKQSEIWSVTRIKEEKKVDGTPDGITLFVQGPTASNSIRLSIPELGGITPEVGDIIHADIYYGYGGIIWSNSMRLEGRDNKGERRVRELIN